MGITTSQILFANDQGKFVKGKGSMSNLNGVSVLEYSHYFLKNKSAWPNEMSGTSFSNGIGENLSMCGVTHPFNKSAREACQAAYYGGKTSQAEIDREKLEIERLAIEQSNQGVWTAGQVAMVSVAAIGALTGMIFVIKKFAK